MRLATTRNGAFSPTSALGNWFQRPYKQQRRPQITHGHLYGGAGVKISGAGNRNRTYDLIITNDALYQLSYSGESRRFYGGVAVAGKRCVDMDRHRVLRARPSRHALTCGAIG